MKCNPQQISRGDCTSRARWAMPNSGSVPCRESCGRLFFETVVMIQRQLLQRRPLLPAMTNELPFILANRTLWRRSAVWLNCAPHCTQIKFSIGLPNLLLTRRDKQGKGRRARVGLARHPSESRGFPLRKLKGNFLGILDSARDDA